MTYLTKVVMDDGTVVGRAAYLVERERTGMCECGIPMEDHPVCEACGALVGFKHECDGEDFRGYHICVSCRVNWYGLDEQLGRVAAWAEFKKPPAELRDKVKIKVEV